MDTKSTSSPSSSPRAKRYYPKIKLTPLKVSSPVEKTSTSSHKHQDILLKLNRMENVFSRKINDLEKEMAQLKIHVNSVSDCRMIQPTAIPDNPEVIKPTTPEVIKIVSDDSEKLSTKRDSFQQFRSIFDTLRRTPPKNC